MNSTLKAFGELMDACCVAMMMWSVAIGIATLAFIFLMLLCPITGQ